jgi:hypothetical protein
MKRSKSQVAKEVARLRAQDREKDFQRLSEAIRRAGERLKTLDLSKQPKGENSDGSKEKD